MAKSHEGHGVAILPGFGELLSAVRGGLLEEGGTTNDLLKKDRAWAWTDRCDQAMAELRQVIASEPVLGLPNFDLPFEVHTDASDRALGAVLVQEGHPIAFESRKLKDAEQRYPAHEKEMLAVIHALQLWRHYFFGD
ncbi:hypothetical protein Scep_004447 [Stephania cephalantha]|uniref:Reverse transcriptase/retrotransposon-derived protein RNase H-like domain-containing protein n=1 Tax=Stephania cephalantha TaxID=152367 RepID=A0AAP0KSH5_9MAGN